MMKALLGGLAIGLLSLGFDDQALAWTFAVTGSVFWALACAAFDTRKQA